MAMASRISACSNAAPSEERFDSYTEADELSFCSVPSFLVATTGEAGFFLLTDTSMGVRLAAEATWPTTLSVSVDDARHDSSERIRRRGAGTWFAESLALADAKREDIGVGSGGACWEGQPSASITAEAFHTERRDRGGGHVSSELKLGPFESFRSVSLA